VTEYTVKAPDGKTVTLQGPPGASQADIIAQAQKLYKPAAAPRAPSVPPAVQQYMTRWQGMRPEQAAALVQRYKGASDNGGQITASDPRIIALQRIAGNAAPGKIAPPKPQPRPMTRDEQITEAGRESGRQMHKGAPDLVVSLTAAARRNSFGIPERITAAAERFLPSALTGNNTNASYDDILKFHQAQTDAQMERSLTGNIIGTIVGGAGVTKAAGGVVANLAGRAAGAASPVLSRAGNVLESLVTMRKGQRVANAARVVAAGGTGGAVQAAGEGSDIGKGAAYGAGGAAVLGTGFKAAQVITRPFRDFLRLSSAGQILSRLTSATSEQLSQRAAAYRQATGAEPTLFELLPLADRNKILKQAVVGRDNVVEATSRNIRNRANNLGPEMSARARQILQPNRDAIDGQIINDLRTARGGQLEQGDVDLARRAMDSPTDMSELRDVEARAIMAPHDNGHVADNFNEILPQAPQNNNGSITMTDADPAVSTIIRSAAPGGFRAGTSGENPAQPVTVADIGSMIETLRGDLGKGGIEARTAQRAIDHLQDVLAERAPEAAAAHQQMTDAYAARSRMMEGMGEGAATRLRDNVQVGTSRRQARTVRNAYDTPEGAAGRSLGQGNRVLTDLGGSPEEALRGTVAISRNSTGRQLAQNVGPAPATDIMAAARAQDESAQALAAASGKLQSGGENGDGEALVQAIVGLHPSSFITTKAGAMRKLLDMTYIPESRARVIVDMIFSQNPDMMRRAISAVGNAPNGANFLQSLAGTVGAMSSGSGTAGGELPGDHPSMDPGLAGDVPQAEIVPDEQPAEDPAAAAQPVDPSSSPYAANLQQIYDSENPEFLDLINRQFQQESGNQQFDANGQPITSSAGAVGIAQVMPDTGPEAAKLAGVPWDENAYHNDPAYNKLIGIAYMAEQLRKYRGDVARALAAYNAGPGRVDDALALGDDWLSHLPDETQDYVGKVL
jgi:hypothetical protein